MVRETCVLAARSEIHGYNPSRVQIGVDPPSWMPVRQSISHMTNGETLTIDYSGMAKT